MLAKMQKKRHSTQDSEKDTASIIIANSHLVPLLADLKKGSQSGFMNQTRIALFADLIPLSAWNNIEMATRKEDSELRVKSPVSSLTHTSE
jgi:hypothetical protein